MKMKNLSGMRFGYLTAINPEGRAEDRRIIWKCECDCGNEVLVKSKYLIDGNVKSCGCKTNSMKKKSVTKHGFRADKELPDIYKKWVGMKERCFNRNSISYSNYGGRGITVCDEWRDNFQAFYDWAMENGYKDGLTIDRIDNDGNYCPENCRWITNGEQQNNTRRNINIFYNGETKTLAEWAKSFNIPYDLLYYRIAIKKVSMDTALLELGRKNSGNKKQSGLCEPNTGK